MEKAWEVSFTTWAQGPGKTEQEKCEHAESAVKKAIAASKELAPLPITVRPHGSYRVRTNIRQDSDVDIYVRLDQPDFFPEYPLGKTKTDFGNIDGSVDYADFKNKVESALKGYLGSGAVTRGDKAFDVHQNTYRIDADVIVVLPHRRYTGRFANDGSHQYVEGISFRTDAGVLVHSWPDQTYDNGVAKNDATSRRYKRVIRILKNLRNYMQEKGVKEASGIASFLIESLVWNVPSNRFGSGPYWEDVRATLAYLITASSTRESVKEWGEVNELFYLWHSGQPWTLAQANAFLIAAWRFIGFS